MFSYIYVIATIAYNNLLTILTANVFNKIIINPAADLLFNILSIGRIESCSCFGFVTLYYRVRFNKAIKPTVGFITVLRSTFTLNIVIGLPTDYTYGNTVLRRSPQISLTKSDSESAHNISHYGSQFNTGVIYREMC